MLFWTYSGMQNVSAPDATVEFGWCRCYTPRLHTLWAKVITGNTYSSDIFLYNIWGISDRLLSLCILIDTHIYICITFVQRLQNIFFFLQILAYINQIILWPFYNRWYGTHWSQNYWLSLGLHEETKATSPKMQTCGNFSPKCLEQP